MKETLMSTRFWILLAIIIGVVVLAALGKVTGQSVMYMLTSLLAGFGVGKTSGVKVISVSPKKASGTIFPDDE